MNLRCYFLVRCCDVLQNNCRFLLITPYVCEISITKHALNVTVLSYSVAVNLMLIEFFCGRKKKKPE